MLFLRRSADLSDSEVNEQLERSLKKVTRLVSVPENEKLEEENKFLLTRLSSVVEQLSLGVSNGATVAMESGNFYDDTSVSRPTHTHTHTHTHLLLKNYKQQRRSFMQSVFLLTQGTSKQIQS